MRNDRKINRSHGRRGHRLLGTLVIGGIAVLAVAFLLSRGGQAAAGEPTIPRGASLTSWSENGQGGRYLLQIVDGNAPATGARVSGIVLSDTACEPDARGFSHCHNAIQLASGTRLSVIDTHRMSRYRCLRSGDAVSLTRINASWVVAKLT
jgi:hypothetical protein